MVEVEYRVARQLLDLICKEGYTVKNVIVFPVSSRDVKSQTLPG
jgi:hypothetical protein